MAGIFIVVFCIAGIWVPQMDLLLQCRIVSSQLQCASWNSCWWYDLVKLSVKLLSSFSFMVVCFAVPQYNMITAFSKLGANTLYVYVLQKAVIDDPWLQQCVKIALAKVALYNQVLIVAPISLAVT